MRREFVQLAHRLGDRDKVGGAFVSPKLDGVRALWDGGATRGLPVSLVPWANTERDVGEKVSTGLWSRLGKVIPAPDWWLDGLPVEVALDGELWMSYGVGLEEVMAVKRIEDRSVWSEVRYMVFDRPSLGFLGEGEIVYDARTRKRWAGTTMGQSGFVESGMPFSRRRGLLQPLSGVGGVLGVVEYTQLAKDENGARGELERLLERELDRGGEGLMVRAPGDLWLPQRRRGLLKVKPTLEGVGVVVNHTPGEGKLAGLMGAVVVEWMGKTLRVSGFTDAERKWDVVERKWPVGGKIEFKFTSLTSAGVPREARYDRGEE